ncbi:MBL fold metallo-hydrolase [Phenylobacterium sp.]|uniref:MBL fold metallo-hydrolase n=1 Tax=Phenylobacterium sp. TaxID=1871053 RepID=UPI0025D8669F|nr:MBL fold metallo-hydrolase [Phenylobacterium sp.]
MRTLAAALAATLLAATADAQPLTSAQPTSAGADQTEALHFAGGRVHQAIGFGNTYMVTTKAGNVIVDTSMPGPAKRHHKLLTAVSDAPVRYIILTHAHGDHTGGVPLWKGPGTKVVGQAQETEFLDYQTRLSGFFAYRNAAQYDNTAGARRNEALNPGNHAAPKLADILFEKEMTLKVGDLTFRLMSTPGETPDHLTVWVPELKAAFIGDNFYGSFPNIYTLRGTQQRKALEYVDSLNKVLALNPEIIFPSHGEPIVGADKVRAALTKYRDAILYVHDATVKGMNEGQDVFTLMKTVKLPPELYVGEGYGQVAWSVRGIYEGYAGWFDNDAATMYPVSPAEAQGELARLAGGAAPIAARAAELNAQGQNALALRLTSAALAADPKNAAALAARRDALKALLAKSGNSNESGWLNAALRQVETAKASAAP